MDMMDMWVCRCVCGHDGCVCRCIYNGSSYLNGHDFPGSMLAHIHHRLSVLEPYVKGLYQAIICQSTTLPTLSEAWSTCVPFSVSSKRPPPTVCPLLVRVLSRQCSSYPLFCGPLVSLCSWSPDLYMFMVPWSVYVHGPLVCMFPWSACVHGPLVCMFPWCACVHGSPNNVSSVS